MVEVTQELKPCPFCGGEAVYVDPYFFQGDRQGGYVRCTKCSAQNENKRLVTDPHPITAWNTRAAPDEEMSYWNGVAQSMGYPSVCEAMEALSEFRVAPDAEPAAQGCHPSHDTRISDASSYDEICKNCGATDGIGTWGKLAEPCPARPAERVAPAAVEAH